ncbi:MAG: isoprenyl transferase [Planctomycetota bacterium]|nr:MAG: isoprenyl transferase [Planctomycetota bacterium]
MEQRSGAVCDARDAILQKLGLRPEQLPRHVAVIMDGNGRWARRRSLPRIEGHRRGVRSVRAVVEECARLRLEQLTLYCFSSENWKRPREEQDLLMDLLVQYLISERDEIMRQNIRFRTIGRIQELPRRVQREIACTTTLSRDNTGMTLCLALNYGSRCEIVDAVRRIAGQIRAGQLEPAQIDEATVAANLYTADMPDPDLVIRTAGEMRLSNYLLWQISYAELWVTRDCWPDFGIEHLHRALIDYAGRTRRYGGLVEEEPVAASATPSGETAETGH